jgi:hypothetical protein
MIQRQIESNVLVHSVLQLVIVASAGMPFLCLADAINATRVAASWPTGWHAKTTVNIFPLTLVGANLQEYS